MRRSTSTIVYVVLFIAVLGFALIFNNRTKTADEIALPTDEVATDVPVEYLFTPADGFPNLIEVKAKTGEIVRLTRNAENAWVVVLPQMAAADQGSVEAAVTQISTMRILERLSNLSPDAVGLDDPDYVLTIRFANNVERKVKVGVSTPTGSGYYSFDRNDSIIILSNSSVDPLLGLLTTPPYLPTEVPTIIDSSPTTP